jgi:Lon protease-like protein/HEAT repeat protein
MFFFGPPNIDKLLKKKDVRGLIKALSYPKDESICLAAIKALGELKFNMRHYWDITELEKNTTDQLLLEAHITAALKNNSENVRSKAVWALESWNKPFDPPKKAIEVLTHAINDSSEKVRHAAAICLGAQCATDELVNLLKVSNGRVRLSVIEGLGHARAIEPLSDLLSDNNEDVRLAAVLALGETTDWGAVTSLISALNDSSETVRDASLESLAKIGTPSIGPLINALLAQQVIISQPQLEATFDSIELKRKPYNYGLGIMPPDFIPDGFLEIGRSVMVLIKRALATPRISEEFYSKLTHILKSPKLASRIPLDILHDLNNIENGVRVEITHYDSEWSDSPDAMYASPASDVEEEFTLDCSKVRELAKRELDRKEQKRREKSTQRKKSAQNIPSELPILPLHDVVIFPSAAVPLTIGTKSSLRLVNDAMEGSNHLIGVSMIKDNSTPKIDLDKIYPIGTVAVIRHLFNAPDGNVRIVVEGIERIRINIVKPIAVEPYLKTQVEVLKENIQQNAETKKLMSNMLDLFRRWGALQQDMPQDILDSVIDKRQPLDLVYSVANISLQNKDYKEAQELLELDSINEKLVMLIALITKSLG